MFLILQVCSDCRKSNFKQLLARLYIMAACQQREDSLCSISPFGCYSHKESQPQMASHCFPDPPMGGILPESDSPGQVRL